MAAKKPKFYKLKPGSLFVKISNQTAETIGEYNARKDQHRVQLRSHTAVSRSEKKA